MLDTPMQNGAPTLSRAKIESLVGGIVHIANTHGSLAERRQATLELLLKLLDARVGHWAWGYGDVVTSGLLPVAILFAGYTPEEVVILSTMGLDTEASQVFRSRILQQMEGSNHSTVIRPEIIPDLEWHDSKMRSYLQQMNVDEWVHSVRYQSANVWANIMILRNANEPEFDASDTALLDIAMQSISWLHATEDENIPKDLLVDLTDRQRLVTLLLLDGLSRKLIAANLGITEDTVGDHIKSIFKHFNVNSATELAAIFLRNK